MNTGRNSKQTTCLCRDTGGKGTLPAQHTTFNTLDNWGHKPSPNQKGKGPERKGYRVMARNMYTIHSVTSGSCASNARQPSGSSPWHCSCQPAPQASALLPGHMWLEADWRTPPSTCNQHQERWQYLGIQHVLPKTWGLGHYHWALSWGWQALHTLHV